MRRELQQIKWKNSRQLSWYIKNRLHVFDRKLANWTHTRLDSAERRKHVTSSFKCSL
ncbi:hypothetical protein CK203_033325 [Vitis vinifera]|uniref:Uncharacterized protein n=1 Tax=Vitis vinifera TaxID=29760 RepID=A0A438HC04_VITVI|nr:hypothetical protein CK203_033325 [Vitis vinifera]